MLLEPFILQQIRKIQYPEDVEDRTSDEKLAAMSAIERSQYNRDKYDKAVNRESKLKLNENKPPNPP